ncbi:CoA transferase [Micromonospora olivasterospora]|uniref:Crotonobetainyl-CoA:carnitine CoA-transferase CaiB-like acyl-CoA transferase n=1 Tax=Micromonospora olivasterospora TaxID=1880 RepID=A0A562I2N1_MICOL|nr:CoA transferase [Micromonospora olivasterospora]TWH65301.1 crotonobetainyl-CoA:carnitine CoA-transferase CaiB-like acyl-CoA transferase [Micromonospora olivasterospora]
MTGPLAGLRVVELGGIGPTPHAGMVLADLGADVVRIVRSHADAAALATHVLRGRTTVVANLKDPADRDEVLGLIGAADVVIEGFRPGTTERLGLGPDTCLAAHPGLVYGRVTGWGQDGPLASTAGHDINYVSVTGILHAIGPADRPVPPLNLVGDYAGGSMYLLLGILAALWERTVSGRGQVVDAAMVDGVASLGQQILELRAEGTWGDERESNLLDGGAPFYRTYECADGRFVAVGAIEPQFYALLLEGLSLTDGDLPEQNDTSGWCELSTVFAERFKQRTRDEWAEVFVGSDACVTPVLSFVEAVEHPQLAARRSVVETPSGPAGAPAPRFSRSASCVTADSALMDLLAARGRWGGRRRFRRPEHSLDERSRAIDAGGRLTLGGHTLEQVQTWSPQLAAANTTLTRNVEAFLFDEANLLDDWRLHEWLELFVPEGTYLMPSTDLPNGDPGRDLFLIQDDRFLLEHRVNSLLTRSAHAEYPHSRTRRMITNVQARPENADHVRVKANFAVFRVRSGILDTYVGTYRHVLRVTSEGFRFVERKSVLDLDALRPQAKVSIIL